MYRNIKIKILLVGCVFFLTSFSNHKYYVSTTQIAYVSASESLQITMRVFTDDMEALLQHRYWDQYKLHPDNYPERIDRTINKYVSSKLNIAIDDIPLKLQFVGKKYKDDQVVCYFEVEQVAPFKKIEISNSLLFDLFEDQQNIIHFSTDSLKKSLLQVQGNAKNAIFL